MQQRTEPGRSSDVSSSSRQELSENEPQCKVFVCATKCDLWWTEAPRERAAAGGGPAAPPSTSAVGEGGETEAEAGDERQQGTAAATPSDDADPDLVLPGPPSHGSMQRRTVDPEEVEAFVRGMGAEYHETSARSGRGVHELFLAVAHAVIDMPVRECSGPLLAP